MARISRDKLEYCSQHNECLDCHAEQEVRTAEVFQKRGRFKVPLCRPHFNAYKSRNSQINARKYLRRCEIKGRARQCVYSGCHHKLIPQELLPPSISETTCGMHGSLKVFRKNRTAFLRLIIEHCLNDQERKGTPQNIVYERGGGFVWFYAEHLGYNQLKCFSARGLLGLYKRV